MLSQYKQQEESLRTIVDNNIKPKQNDRKLVVNIYYKNKTLQNLLMTNNLHKTPFEQRSHLVYRYECKKEGCLSSTYIGYTESSLVLRMRNHAQSGSILKHSWDVHKTKISTNEIVADIKILRHLNTKEDLTIAEALLIKTNNPSLNGQREGEDRVLSIF